MIKYNRVTSPLTQISNGMKSWLVIDVIFMLLQLFQDTFKYIVYFSLRGVLAAISSPWRKDVKRKVEVESRKENEARKWTNRRGEEKRRERENGGAAWKRRRRVEDGVRIKGREGPRERGGPPERGVQDWLGTGGARHTFGGSLIFRVWPGPSGTAKTCPRTFCSRDHFCILLSINNRVA